VRELRYTADQISREVSVEIQLLRDSIDQSHASFFRWLLAANLAILFVTAPTFIWVLRSVTSPVQRLADVFRALAGGSEEAIQKETYARDEIGDLYDAASRFRDENIRERRLLEDYRELSQTLERQVAERTLELEKKNEELHHLASVDRLTKTFNRRALDRSLAEELSRASRYGRSMSVLLFDIDFFKHVNDRYGHLAGDKVLVGLTDCIRANMRSCDRLGRWGGEEFLLICPEADVDRAQGFAERIRKAVESAQLPVPQTVTVSVGVTGFVDGDDIDSILSRVDKALYKAKSSGRNRACVA